MSSIERVTRALEEMRSGRMVILVDDEDRENEGDLVFAADMVTRSTSTSWRPTGAGSSASRWMTT